MSLLSKPVSGELQETDVKTARPYANPYLAGFGLGLVLLAAFLIMGRGLGASGAFGSIITAGLHSANPQIVESNKFFEEYYGDGSVSPLKDWLVFEVVGVLIGGFLSGLFANRIKRTVEKGPNISIRGRLLFAFAGGTLMGIGAKFARGCTSGQALTGGALLNVGSWTFMMMVFAGAYGAAYFLRRQWR